MGPVSGLMILGGLLLMGAAVAIPASQSLQESNMRSRLAEMAARAEQVVSPPPATLPAIVQYDDEEEEAQVDEEVEPAPVEPAPVKPDPAPAPAPPAPTPPPSMPPPVHITVPSVGIDAEVVEVGFQVVEIAGQRVREWEVAAYAAGHHNSSANPGEGSNIVITGHNDWEGEVFRTLEHVEIGHDIFLTTPAGEFRYVVSEVHLRREVNVSLEERLETGRLMDPTPDERLTLITCWPYGINDHRIIVIATPAPWEMIPPDRDAPVT
jgi:sortase A